MKRELIFTFCCLLTTLVWSQEYQRTETGIKASIFGKKIDVEVQWFNANSLRVLKMPHGQSVDKKSLSVIARPEKTALKVSTSEDGNIVMKSRLLTVKLDTKTGPAPRPPAGRRFRTAPFPPGTPDWHGPQATPRPLRRSYPFLFSSSSLSHLSARMKF